MAYAGVDPAGLQRLHRTCGQVGEQLARIRGDVIATAAAVGHPVDPGPLECVERWLDQQRADLTRRAALDEAVRATGQPWYIPVRADVDRDWWAAVTVLWGWAGTALGGGGKAAVDRARYLVPGNGFGPSDATGEARADRYVRWGRRLGAVGGRMGHLSTTQAFLNAARGQWTEDRFRQDLSDGSKHRRVAGAVLLEGGGAVLGGAVGARIGGAAGGAAGAKAGPPGAVVGAVAGATAGGGAGGLAGRQAGGWVKRQVFARTGSRAPRSDREEDAR